MQIIRALVIGLLGVFASPLLATAQQDELKISRVRVAPGRTLTAVTQAIVGAARRLEDADCRRVLSDFRDASGRTPLVRLAEMHTTATRFLALLWFVEATHPGCDDPGLGAFTQVGGRVIFVCGRNFSASGDSKSRELLVIHELLHALGIDEQGQSSQEISRRVAGRCTNAWP